jgi:TolB-like protein/Tfp pilus assembly protein PilF
MSFVSDMSTFLTRSDYTAPSVTEHPAAPMSLTPGTRLGRYEILSPLGAGGMGEVYRAHDPTLGRDVALKTLSPDFAQDPARLGRFAREARAIAALNHPHIVTIYSTEEAGEIHFLTMELVEGQTLDGVIPSGGVALVRFLDLAIPLTDALTAAHQKQVTHRDLKPANVMVTADGRVKVLDFGLARIGTAADDRTVEATRAALTREGSVVGTMPYMSPEQIEGKPLDHRSDLFSLGIMFYEMLTGVRPFLAESSPLLMAAILRDTPPPVNEWRPDVPDATSRLIDRCLEKRPEDRVQTARDVYNELRHLQKQLDSGALRRSSTPSTTVKIDGPGPKETGGLWMAVLPFTSRTVDEESTLLAEGLTDDITAGLARFSHLRVVSRASIQRLDTALGDARAAGAHVGARYVLEGSVRSAGATLRIAARLVDTETGAHLWAENYDRQKGASLFELQDDVASRIIATVGSPSGFLIRSMATALKARPIEELTTRELLVRFEAYVEHFRPEEHARLREAVERALQREPGIAAAWACAAMLYEHEYSHGLNPLPDPLRRLRQAAERAIEIDQMNQHAWMALISASFFERDQAGVRAAAERTIAINPLNVQTLAYAGIFLSGAGDYERAAELVQRALSLSPEQQPGWYFFVLFNHAYARGDYEDALVHAKRINMPLFPWSHLSSAAAAGQLGRAAEARAALDALARTHPGLLDQQRMRQEWGVWIWDADMFERLMQGVEKARALATATPTPASGVEREASIAVVPFTDLSPARDQQWFCDGIAEEILNALAQISGLRVAARTSAFSFRDAADLLAIGEKLRVATALQGSVRRSGERVRITVQLVDLHNGFQLWSDRYDRELEDIFDIQDEIARGVVGRLRGALSDHASTLVSRPTTSVDAYQLLLRGRELLNKRGRAILEGRTFFERAIELDPGLAEAHALLGDSYRLIGLYGIAPATDVMPRARAAAERALALDSNQVDALATLANLKAVHDWDVSGSIAMSARALAIDPNHVRALVEQAVAVACLAQVPPEVEERTRRGIRKACELDPLNAWAIAIDGFCAGLTNRVDEAAAKARHAVSLDPDNFTARWVLVWTLSAAGQHETALHEADAALMMSGRAPRLLTEVAAIHAARGHVAEAEAVYQELRGRASTGFVGSSELGAAAASAGRMEEARRLVAQGIEARDTYLSFWKLPAWAAVRADAEGMRLLRSTGIAD